MVQRRTRTSFAKEIYYILCLAVFIVGTIFAIWGPGGWRELKKAQRELETRRARVDALRLANNEKMRSIEALRSDKEAQEKYAREKGYARNGEIIVQIPIPQHSSQLPSKP